MQIFDSELVFDQNDLLEIDGNRYYYLYLDCELK